MVKYLIFVLWMIFTVILAISIVGAIVLITPHPNNTNYYKSQEELRSTWMRIGYGLYEQLKQSK